MLLSRSRNARPGGSWRCWAHPNYLSSPRAPIEHLSSRKLSNNLVPVAQYLLYCWSPVAGGGLNQHPSWPIVVEIEASKDNPEPRRLAVVRAQDACALLGVGAGCT